METTNTNAQQLFRTNYAVAVNWMANDFVQCNKLPDIDPSIWDNMRANLYDEETESETEIFQWYITNCSEDDVNFLEQFFPALIFTYSDLLDCFILCVDHWGTAWDYVGTSTTIENAARELGERK